MREGGVKRDWNRYERHILPIHGGKGIYYGEIMIYVNGRRDVRLSKGWRYEPIMINALHPCVHPAPPVHSSVTRGEALQRSPSFRLSTELALFSICTTTPHPVLWFHGLLLYRYSPLFFSVVLPMCCCLFHVICPYGDQCYCS